MANEIKKIDWNKIWKFIKNIKKEIYYALVLIILLIIIAQQCSSNHNLKREKQISDQNADAAKNELLIEKKKNGELLVSVSGYIATEKELKTLNKQLWEKVKAQDGQIISLSHSIILLKQDSTMLAKYLVEKDKLIEKLIKIDSNTYAAPWKLTYVYDKDTNNYDIFTGKTYIAVSNKNPLELVHVDTKLIERLTKIDLSWGQKVEKDKLRVFIDSKYPGFTVQQLEGVLLDPNSNPFIKDLIKKKHFFTGFSLGPNISVGYNFIQNEPALIIGFGLQYNIYQW